LDPNVVHSHTRYGQSEDFCAAESAAAAQQYLVGVLRFRSTFNHFSFMLLPDKVPDAARDEEVPSHVRNLAIQLLASH
jgi:hypothetical protein